MEGSTPPDKARLDAAFTELYRAHLRDVYSYSYYRVGNHHDARAFEDLAEFIDHFLFLGSIHGFTPSMGVSPRLKSAPEEFRSSRVRDGPEARIARGQPPEFQSRSPSQEGFMGFPPPSVSDRTGRVRPVIRRAPGPENFVGWGSTPPMSMRRRRSQVERYARPHRR